MNVNKLVKTICLTGLTLMLTFLFNQYRDQERFFIPIKCKIQPVSQGKILIHTDITKEQMINSHHFFQNDSERITYNQTCYFNVCLTNLVNDNLCRYSLNQRSVSLSPPSFYYEEIIFFLLILILLISNLLEIDI